jgi:hypothetical protein
VSKFKLDGIFAQHGIVIPDFHEPVFTIVESNMHSRFIGEVFHRGDQIVGDVEGHYGKASCEIDLSEKKLIMWQMYTKNASVYFSLLRDEKEPTIFRGWFITHSAHGFCKAQLTKQVN